MISLKLFFFDPSRDLAVATNFCWFYPQPIFVTPVFSGAAGQANVGLLPASGLVNVHAVESWLHAGT